MKQAYQAKVQELKKGILKYLSRNNRHYGDLTRLEQQVEDLAQALNTRLDQLLLGIENDGAAPEIATDPRGRLADRLLATATALQSGGRVDEETADDFDKLLDSFDLAADLQRQSASVKDKAETAAIKHKRGRS